MPDARRNVYQPIDHTGDLGMLVFGADLHELFTHAAWGLCDLMTDAERVEPRLSRDLAVEAIDLETSWCAGSASCSTPTTPIGS